MVAILVGRQSSQAQAPEYNLQLGAQSNESSNSTAASSLAQYSYGLHGVNVILDNQSSTALYIGISVILVALVILRLVQRVNGHLRELTTYGSHEKQAFWARNTSPAWASIKRHIQYAPLRRVRHNKEIQITSAVSIGTLPGRLDVFLLVCFLLAQIAFMTILDYTGPQQATLAELRGRSGHLAIMNMIAMFVMAGRNNPFIRLLRVSFDTFNLFHRWIGRTIIIEIVIHLVAWAVVKAQTSDQQSLMQSLFGAPFLTWGFVGVIAAILIFFQSPSPIRHAAYETFLCLHQFYVAVLLVGTFYHAQLGSLPQYGFVVVIILIWSYDRIFRLGRILYYNFSLKHGFTRVTVEALAGNACRVTFYTPRPFAPVAGSHVYAYLPQIAWWQSHPFSVAWTTSTDDIKTNGKDLEKGGIVSQTQTSLSLVIQAKTGMTKKLYDLANNANGRRVTLTGFVEGPYGALESFHSYGTVMLFAGGVGITHHLPHVRDLIKGYANKTISTQKVTLIWTIRDESSLDWVRPWMDEMLGMPDRRDVFTIKIFVTKSRQAKLQDASARVQMSKGRPDIERLVQEEFRNRVGAMCVSVCGPGALADDVRRETRRVVDKGKVDFFEEAFTW